MGFNLHPLRRRDMKTLILIVVVLALCCSTTPALRGGEDQNLAKQKRGTYPCNGDQCYGTWEKQCNGDIEFVADDDEFPACPRNLYRCPCGDCIRKARCDAMIFRLGRYSWRRLSLSQRRQTSYGRK